MMLKQTTLDRLRVRLNVILFSLIFLKLLEDDIKNFILSITNENTIIYRNEKLENVAINDV